MWLLVLITMENFIAYIFIHLDHGQIEFVEMGYFLFCRCFSWKSIRRQSPDSIVGFMWWCEAFRSPGSCVWYRSFKVECESSRTGGKFILQIKLLRIHCVLLLIKLPPSSCMYCFHVTKISTKYQITWDVLICDLTLCTD